MASPVEPALKSFQGHSRPNASPTEPFLAGRSAGRALVRLDFYSTWHEKLMRQSHASFSPSIGGIQAKEKILRGRRSLFVGR